MKKFILSALAATLVASPLLAAAPAEAQQRREVTTVRHNDNGRTVVTKRTVVRTPQYRNWRAGQRFDRRQAQNYRVITTYRNYRLAAPPRGSQWVRSGNDALLINGRGNVVQVRGGAFR
ncbi:Ni/Co efflux regulator RcnB [Sphingomonas sp. PP-F2F-G114-C0414]|jgi:Ni/Co efflux regulator RcnB|uniref:RcnB family protein n=1 Tax=Sphingomonas TaxID=13687 RepID=UPI000EF8B078|nr:MULTISPECIES: RcnB family protein [unclassified Sphingomonas]RMB37414.1 Ni/Co efflux regulator RcnB [Sphingomonas sp. PP-F2F-G114-C0414]TCP71697.1 Ni/Co efflux regulator RcnB [Sphingomonas sp. PP-CE-1G-424]